MHVCCGTSEISIGSSNPISFSRFIGGRFFGHAGSVLVGRAGGGDGVTAGRGDGGSIELATSSADVRLHATTINNTIGLTTITTCEHGCYLPSIYLDLPTR